MKALVPPLLLVFTLATACGGRSEDEIVRDARRVVSTLPGITETVVALGARDRLVGVSAWDAESGAYEGIAAVPVSPAISAEAVAALSPDLILVDPTFSPSDVPRLRERFPGTFACDSTSLDGLARTFERLGEALGKREAARRLADELASARRKSRLESAPRVLLLAWADPPMALGPGSLLDDMVRAIGAENVASDLGRASGEFPSERVLERAPDAILLTGGTFPDSLKERWASVPAVKNDRILDLTADEFVRAGPRTAGALRQLSSLLASVPATSHRGGMEAFLPRLGLVAFAFVLAGVLLLRPARGARAAAGPLLALAFAAAAAVVAVLVGPARLSIGDALAALLGGDASPAAKDIVWVERVPRVALGLAVGAGLSVAGVLFQSLLRNPLADPYLVGVGPGALFGAAVAGAFGLVGTSVLGFGAMGIASFVGAIGAAALVLFVTGRAGRASAPRIVLAGVAVGAFTTAIATWALYAESENWQNAVRWLLGSLAWANPARVTVATAAAVGLALVAFWRARDLDALSLGEDSARLGGVDVRRVVPALLLAACALTAAAVATAGLVGFVGLVVPHAARRLSGPLHRRAVPVAAGLGAGLLVLSDAAARVATRVEIPVGVVTALVGAPAFALLLRRTNRGG